MRALSGDLDSFERHVASRSERLLNSLAVSCGAVPLKPLVTRSGVRRVIFRKLPVAGGLSVDKSGFNIYVKANQDEARHWMQIFNADNDGGLGLPGRVRFTIAHEIAHTFFFDWDNGSPISLVDFSDPSRLERVERACQVAAGALLLPEKRLRAFVESREWTPRLVRSAAAHFRVSLQALFMRMREIRGLVPAHGLAALVHNRGGRCSIDFLIGGDEICHRFKDAPLEYLADSLQLSRNRLIERECSWTVPFPDNWADGTVATRDCDLRLEPVYSRLGSFLLTGVIASSSQLLLPFWQNR